MDSYEYWAYYTLGNITQPYEVHLARSNSLTSGWVDEGKVFDGRWPSVYCDSSGPTFHMFYREPAGTYQLRRATSSDGLSWTFQEDVCAGANPFIWKNPNDSQWYLVYHNTGGAGYRILIRSAATITGLAAASDTTLLDRTDIVASPTIFYDGTQYWLFVEEFTSNLWRTTSYYSSSITGPYTRENIILPNDDACGMVLEKASTLYFYYCQRTNRTSEYWDIVLRTASI